MKLHLEHALEIKERAYGPDHREVAVTLAVLANMYGELGEMRKKKQLLKRTLAIHETDGGPATCETARTLTNLANVYGNLGDGDQMVDCLERALAIEEEEYGCDHVEVAITLESLSAAYDTLGQNDRSEELLKRALAINETTYGRDNHNIVVTLMSLAKLYKDLGKMTQVLQVLHRVLTINLATFGPDHLEVGSVLQHLARTYGVMGDMARHKEISEEAIAISESPQPKKQERFDASPFVLNSCCIDGHSLSRLHEKRTALERTLYILELSCGPDGHMHLELASTLSSLANVHGALANPYHMKDILERCLKIQEEAFGRDNNQLIPTLTGSALAQAACGSSARAKGMSARATWIAGHSLSFPSVPSAEVSFASALVQLAAGDNKIDAGARDAWEEGVFELESALGQDRAKAALEAYCERMAVFWAKAKRSDLVDWLNATLHQGK
jgi:tetratricopeptide (TPR) repeat protein